MDDLRPGDTVRARLCARDYTVDYRDYVVLAGDDGGVVLVEPGTRDVRADEHCPAGRMHPIDKAFYDLTVQQRNDAWRWRAETERRLRLLLDDVNGWLAGGIPQSAMSDVRLRLGHILGASDADA